MLASAFCLDYWLTHCFPQFAFAQFTFVRFIGMCVLLLTVTWVVGSGQRCNMRNCVTSLRTDLLKSHILTIFRLSLRFMKKVESSFEMMFLHNIICYMLHNNHFGARTAKSRDLIECFCKKKKKVFWLIFKNEPSFCCPPMTLLVQKLQDDSNKSWNLGSWNDPNTWKGGFWWCRKAKRMITTVLAWWQMAQHCARKSFFISLHQHPLGISQWPSLSSLSAFSLLSLLWFNQCRACDEAR